MSGPITPPLTVETLDGATTGRPITTLKVSNGDLTIAGNVATIDTSGGGGGTGTVTSIALEGDTGTTTAITTAGAFKIVGAGTTGVTATGTTVTVTSNDQFAGTVTSVTSGGAPLDVDNTDATQPIVSMTQSNGGVDGWLSSTDWTTFNNKGSVTNVSGALPIVSSGGSAPSISINQSATAADGYLSATDWNTFNNKQAALSLTTTGTSGAATLVGATLNVPQYSGGGGGGTITGSITDTQVAFGDTTADSIQGSANLTFDGSNLSLTGYVKSGAGLVTAPAYTFTAADDVGMYLNGSTLHFTAGNTDLMNLQHDGTATNVRIGNGTGEAYISSKSATNLTLQTNHGTNSGTIVIAPGVDGQISITPNGAGTIKLDGVELDNTAIATGYVLKATSATEAGWAAESGGGGGFTGSLADTQLAFGDTTADSIQGSARLTFDGSGTGATLTIGEAGTNYPRLAIRGNNAFINFQDSSNNATGQIGVLSSSTGITFKTTASNTERLRISGDGSFGLSGANYGTSGQVITSSGTGSPPTWTTVGGSDNTPGIPTGNADLYQEWLGFGGQAGLVGAGNSNVVSFQWANSATRIRPHVISKTGTLGVAAINVTVVPSTVTAQEVRIGLYNSDSDGGIGDLKAIATISVLASTGVLTGSYVAEAGEDLSVTRGELYLAGFYSNYGSATDAMTVSMNATNSLPTMRLDLDTTPIAGQTYWKSGDFPEPYTAGGNPSDGTGQTWLMMGTTIT